jgi:RNA polymerase sigma-70 factor, ECF subfamily
MAVRNPDFSELNDRLCAGSESAAAGIFHSYAANLVRLANDQLASDLRAKFDGEDVVQSALRSFFQRQRDGQFELTSWNGLWGLLVRITLRKCGRRDVYWRAARRDPQREISLNVLRSQNSDSAWQPLDERPTAHEVAVFREVLEIVLGDLTERQRTILILDLQGCTALEISKQIGRSVRTVRRILGLVREALAVYCDAPLPDAGE